MTECNSELFKFPRVKGRKVQVNFSGGHVTSNGGMLLISHIHWGQTLYLTLA